VRQAEEFLESLARGGECLRVCLVANQHLPRHRFGVPCKSYAVFGFSLC
jgi:hypothetical protein